jgi:transcriptional regulator with XRE-family HTH domain
MARSDIEAGGRFGNAMAQAMEQRGFTLQTLAVEVGATYEHLRKLLKGIAYPSKSLLKELSGVLGVKYLDMDKLVTADKLEHKFGENLFSYMGSTQRLADYEELVPHLTQDQHEMFLTQMRAVVKTNRSSKHKP